MASPRLLAASRAFVLHCLCAALSLVPAAGSVRAENMPDPARLAAMRDSALVHALNTELLDNPSATLTLDRWCAERHLAPAGSKIVAERVRGQDKPADAALRKLLHISAEQPVSYRRVRLRCGERVLSEADNWYVPALLTAEMNRTLETTDTSFGRVVAPLQFRRQTLSATLLPANASAPSPYVLQHRAVLILPDGRPFSALVESYTTEVLATP